MSGLDEIPVDGLAGTLENATRKRETMRLLAAIIYSVARQSRFERRRSISARRPRDAVCHSSVGCGSSDDSWIATLAQQHLENQLGANYTKRHVG
jgi:predicted alpha/beta hydrolase family esterase